jgi:hypothetical protein
LLAKVFQIVAVVNVQVSVVRKRMATLWVLVDRSLLGFRIRVVVVVVIGVVGLLGSLHSSIALQLAGIRAAAEDRASPQHHRCHLLTLEQFLV